jgi:hypothetical protein
VALLAVVLLGLSLRIAGVTQGLPHPTARPDERETLAPLAFFGRGDLNPHWFIYPNLYFYVLWAWIALAFLVHRPAPLAPTYAEMLAQDLPTLILYGRTLSVAAGAATVAVVWWLGRRLGGLGCAATAALLVAVNFLHVRDSHWIKPDVLLGLAYLLGLERLAAFVRAPSARTALVAGACIGLATGVKYNGVLLVLPAFVACVLAAPRRGLAALVPHRHLGTIALAAAVTFLVTCPYLLLDPERVRHDLTVVTLSSFATRPDAVPPADAGWLERAVLFVRSRAFAYHVEVSLRRGCGLLFALATPPAVALAFARRREPFLLLAGVFVVFYGLVIGLSPVHLARYFTPIVPLLALLVGVLVSWLAERSAPRRPWVATAVAAVLLAAEPAARSVAHDRLAARTDTRVLATRWMAEHLPPLAVVAVVGSPLFPIADPELPPGMRRAPNGLRPEQFAAAGVTHVVTHWHHELVAFSRVEESTMAALAPHLRLLAEFTPFRDGPAGRFEVQDAYYVPMFDLDGVERPGPLVRIYAYEPAP